MLLVIDVGNTNITLGVFNGENYLATFRMNTKIQRTSDEYGIALNELIWHQGFEKSDIDACICIRCAGHYAFSRQCDYQIFRRKANGSIRRN